MSEHDAILRVTGAAALTLVAVACTAGLAEALRRGRGRRTREREHAEAVRRHGRHGSHGGMPVPAIPVIPRQRQTGPCAEAVRLTPAERDAFAGLVRRFGEDG
ncbi:hypothetical protein ABZ918_05285 [Streptomyces viridosporus]|uniref:Uncharacterized protein n=2 Tax=Streptomyces viridosporus TaxID=67581 RepID=A0ABX6AER2_STRVD|nr:MULTISPECIES: hypothetical protein [Streptomyces]EFE68928.1 predicted protein [Streptomyces viridosporus ATCC 14672]PWJ02931.1 hypothetical protein DKG34_35595 [Streptomyces sp. NWU49]QEU86238.1 hypothetical protein CP969_17160 [Streptomyces viridosporus T7A]